MFLCYITMRGKKKRDAPSVQLQTQQPERKCLEENNLNNTSEPQHSRGFLSVFIQRA